jgi:hypothetical protein
VGKSLRRATSCNDRAFDEGEDMDIAFRGVTGSATSFAKLLRCTNI